MPTRYSMNVRPIYGPDEPTFGETASRGISNAIASYLKRKSDQDEFANKIADAGGTVDPQPGVMDSMRSRMATIRRHLPGYNPLPDAEANLSRQSPGDFVQATPMRPSYSPMDESNNADSHGVMPINRSLDTAATSRDGVTRSPIANAIETALYRGPNGMTAHAPTARGRMQQAEQDKTAIQQGTQQEQIDALTAAGMPAAEARARVLNNVVRYDETFGQQPRGQGLSGPEFDRREREKQAARIELANIMAQLRSSNNQTPYAKQRLEIMRQNAEARLQALGVGIDRTLVGQKTPEGVDRVVAERDPAEAARIGQVDASVSAARGRLQRTRQSLSTPAPKTGASAPTVPIAQRVAELKKQGFSKQQARAKLLAEGYKLAPGQ